MEAGDGRAVRALGGAGCWRRGEEEDKRKEEKDGGVSCCSHRYERSSNTNPRVVPLDLNERIWLSLRDMKIDPVKIAPRFYPTSFFLSSREDKWYTYNFTVENHLIQACQPTRFEDFVAHIAG